MIERHIDINRFDYDLPDGRIAKFPLAERSSSKLLVYRGGEISEAHFADICLLYTLTLPTICSV